MNKLIASYLGFTYVPHNKAKDKRFAGWQTLDIEPPFLNKHFEGQLVEFGWLCRNHNQLIFHKSWDWLMGAWKKIIENNILIDEFKTKFSNFVAEADIINAHKTLYETIEFLKTKIL